MGSKGVTSIIILILSHSIIFFTTPTSAQVLTVSPPTPACPPLQACVGLLPVLGNIGVGVPQSQPCCSIGLVDADALVCLCAVVKANVFGIDINIPIEELLKVCKKVLQVSPNANNLIYTLSNYYTK
jgi:uncharacterized membrane protein